MCHGDVVVSSPNHANRAVVQYDLIEMKDQLELQPILNDHPSSPCHSLSKLQAKPEMLDPRILKIEMDLAKRYSKDCREV